MAVKRCPLCRRISDGSSVACGCGYTFGQPIETTLALLDDKIRLGRKWAVGGGLCLGLTVAVAVISLILGGSLFLPLIPSIFGFIYFPRGLRLLRGTAQSRRELEKLRGPIVRAQLPDARIVER